MVLGSLGIMKASGAQIIIDAFQALVTNAGKVFYPTDITGNMPMNWAIG
jgi:hypothetical protein